MRQRSSGSTSRWLVAAAAVTGCTLAILPSCETVVTTVNPCGTIFGFCDPVDIDRMFADVPDWDLDPTCTIPYYGLDAGGAGGGGGAQGLGTCAATPVYPFTPGPRPD